MSNYKNSNLTKKDISKEINLSIGLSKSHCNQLTDDLISILKELITDKKINIKNFGTFKILKKKERVGRNPKNKKKYTISSRKSLSFVGAKKLNTIINDL